MKTLTPSASQPMLPDRQKNDRDTLNLSNNSLIIESSALQLKDQLERYKDKISESFAILGGDNKTIISQISGHNNSDLLLGSNIRQVVTHRNIAKDYNTLNTDEQKYRSIYYQDSLRDAIQVIIRKLDEKIEVNNKSYQKLFSNDKVTDFNWKQPQSRMLSALGLKNNQSEAESVYEDSDVSV